MSVLIWTLTAVALLAGVRHAWRREHSRVQMPVASAVLITLALAAAFAAADLSIAAMVTASAAAMVGVGTLLHRSLRSSLMVRENDQLRDLARERADRVAMLSHEIRTPLALIHGAAELLAEGTPGPLTDIQRDFITTIGVNCGQMMTLAEDLLTEARMEAGLFRLQLERVDIRDLARKTIADLRTLHGSRLMLDTPRAPRRLSADPDLLRQVLVNLVSNAMRHAGMQATVTVRITDGEDAVVVAVSDDGAGMDAAQRAALFTRQEIDPARGSETMHPGAGLGLIISKRIVELHGGRLFVDTVPHRGTAMIFTLPTHP